MDDDYEYSQSLSTISSTGRLDERSIPKNYDGFETLLRAAHVLTNTELAPITSVTSSPSKGKMDIGGLLS